MKKINKRKHRKNSNYKYQCSPTSPIYDEVKLYRQLQSGIADGSIVFGDEQSKQHFLKMFESEMLINQTPYSQISFYEYNSICEKIWKDFIKQEKIIVKLTPEKFMQEMQREKERAIAIIEGGIISCRTNACLFKHGAYNYFIVNDIGYGTVCDKCGTSGAILLLMDFENIEELENRVFLPGQETYMMIKLSPHSYEFSRNMPVPINASTDYWYCPYCNELHKFKYDCKIGLQYDQAVVNSCKVN